MRARRPLGLIRAALVITLLLLVTGTGPAAAAPLSSARASSAPAVVPAAATPYIQHVVVVVLENEVLSNVWGHGPYERYLAAQYGNATQYYAACHPSAPNYLVMFAAVVNQCGSDSWNNYTNTSINEELDAAGLSWGAYAESLPSGACADPGSATAGLFATRHVPALWFANVLQNQTYCGDHVLPSDSFNQSLANGTLPNYSYYTPNLCDDGHNGCGGNTTGAQMTAQADAWLDGWLSPILNHTGTYAGAAEQALVNHTAFFITWDEGTGSNSGFAVPGLTGGDNYKWCGQNGASGDAVCGGQIYTSVVSPYSRHTTFTANDSPYGLLRTVEWLFDLPPLANPGGFDNTSGFPAMTTLFRFPATFNVTAQESQLPPNGTWWFNVTGGPTTWTNGTSLTVPLPNGSYAFTASTPLPGWNSPNGTFSVNGTAVNVSVAFSAEQYPVTFTKGGLPPGTWWQLTVDGDRQPGTNQTSVVVNLSEGFQFWVATTNDSTWNSPNGTFPLFGGPWSVNVTFSRVTYLATVTQTSLPATTSWWLNVTNETDVVGMGSRLSVYLPNGSYPFTAQADGNSWSRGAGTLDVAGGAAFASVNFTLEVFPVIFSASGLTVGATWNLTLEGAVRNLSYDGSTSFSEPNGTYSYRVLAPSNAPPLRPNGTFLVAGGPVNVTVGFDPALSVGGLPATPTVVELGGPVSIAGTIQGGTPPFQVRFSGLPPGCNNSTPPTLRCIPSTAGHFTVVLSVTDSVGAIASATTTVVVVVTSGPGPNAIPGAPSWSLDVGLVAVAAIAVGAGFVVARRFRRR
ncbi:MAG: alkaline phosphatase family protein [Thermoplasmata archaeon]|nr:alkaline phosphatase family protein [Thermoplasmata archaeon]